MDDDILDALLLDAAPDVSPGAATLAVHLAAERAAETAQQRGHTPFPRPTRTRLLSGLAAASLLVALGTVTPTLLRPGPGHPPSVAVHITRLSTSIPVTFTDAAGRQVDCLAYLQVSGLDAAARRALLSVAAAPSWQGYGDRLVDDLGVRAAEPAVRDAALARAMSDDVWARAQVVAPGLHRADSPAGTAGPTYHGVLVTCPDAGEQP